VAQPLAGLNGEEILRAWEAATAAEPVGRCAAVLGEVLPDLPIPAALLPIGGCDTLLLALRVGTFGPALSGVSSCPDCGEDVDVDTNASALLAALPAVEAGATRPARLEHGDYTVEYRLPNTADLLAVARAADPGARVVARCVETAEHAGQRVDRDQLPTEVLHAVAECMAGDDPAADIRLRLTCPACAAEWSAHLDVAGVFEAELTGAALQILSEVDELASRYGWSEQQILALSPTRRRTYLELR